MVRSGLEIKEMKQLAPPSLMTLQLQHPCAPCKASCVKCSRTLPCDRCGRLGMVCTPQVRAKRGRPSLLHQPRSLSPVIRGQHQGGSPPPWSTADQIQPPPSVPRPVIPQPIFQPSYAGSTSSTTIRRPKSAAATISHATQPTPCYMPFRLQGSPVLTDAIRFTLASSSICSAVSRMGSEGRLDKFSATRMM